MKRVKVKDIVGEMNTLNITEDVLTWLQTTYGMNDKLAIITYNIINSGNPYLMNNIIEF